MPSIQGAYDLCISLCNSTSPYCRYSQQSNLRLGAISGGYQWFDCSGLMLYVLSKNGFNVPKDWYTGNMITGLLGAGFAEVDINGEWKAGDILWRRKDGSGHTEMVYTGGTASGVTMGAHSAKYSIPNQVSINGSKSSASSWMKIFRYGGSSPTPASRTWMYGTNSQYFTSYGKEQMNNASIIWSYFYNKGWSLNAVSALCGNIMTESTFNPCLIERGQEEAKAGHGLVQWTPPTDLYNDLDALFGSHTDWSNGDKQLDCLYAEYEEYTGMEHRGIGKQWYIKTGYEMTWNEWAVSTDTPERLAGIFMHNYLRPASYASEEKRGEQARWWYNYLSTVDPEGGGETYKRKMPLWMMLLPV